MRAVIPGAPKDCTEQQEEARLIHLYVKGEHNHRLKAVRVPRAIDKPDETASGE